MAPIWALSAYLGSFVIPHQVSAAPSLAMTHLAWNSPQTWGDALWDQITSWGPTLLIGFPLAGIALGVVAYVVVYAGWAVLIKLERKRRIGRASSC